MKRFANKIAIVAGAGSSGPGIGNGKATALRLAREGAIVVCVDRSQKAANETLRLIQEIASSSSSIAIAADVSKEKDAERVVQTTIEKFKQIDILFNNVGVGLSNGGLNVTEEEWDSVMNANLKSILFMCKYVIPEMQKRQSGTIVNNASMAAFHAHLLYAYSTSKAGVVNLTKSLAVYHARDNIRVNCVAPGFIDTPMVAAIMNDTRKKMVNERVPMKRHGTADEVAAVVCFLFSDDASFITGETIRVDGGLSAM